MAKSLISAAVKLGYIDRAQKEKSKNTEKKRGKARIMP